jgi:hypothetical protein
VAVLRAAAAALLGAAAALCACAAPAAQEPQLASRPPSASAELAGPGAGACAWFGDARSETLYFGVSAFWHALHAASGDPTAELRAGGAREIGRFDLAREQLLPPLAIGPEGARSGVWDVLAHPNGWLYFTTFWERAGRVDPASGAVEWFDAAGDGLNELALLPDGRVLATRYGRGGASGAVVVLSERGDVLAEHPLAAPDGVVAAAKSIGYDPSRNAAWLNTDLLSAAGGVAAHDARVIALADGRELARWSSPELQFMTFAADGVGFLVERSEERLMLRVVPPDSAAPLQLAGRLLVLDEAFPPLDFAQDVKLASDGSAIVTRWSGVVHVASPGGRLRRLELPKREGALYYTAVAKDGEICATRCAGIGVVCERLGR